jgi:hypothetical protein
MPVEPVKDFCMLHDLGLATRYAALASAGITHLSLDRSGAVVSGNSSSHNLLLIAGAIGLLVILGIVVAVVFVRHKRAKAGDESGDQSGSAVFHNRPGYAGYGQNYSSGMIAAEQDPWPWARKPSPPIGYKAERQTAKQLETSWARKPSPPTGYNPMTPVPEMLRTASDPMTPVPEVAAVPALPMQYAVQSPPVQRPPVQSPPVMVPDPALEAIMRQAQVGLFALPTHNKGQKDREAAL